MISENIRGNVSTLLSLFDCGKLTEHAVVNLANLLLDDAVDVALLEQRAVPLDQRQVLDLNNLPANVTPLRRPPFHGPMGGAA